MATDLHAQTTEFNVDPDVPFLGGGVNPSSYGVDPEQQVPDMAQRKPSRFQSLRRQVFYRRPTSPTVDMDDGQSVAQSFPEPQQYVQNHPPVMMPIPQGQGTQMLYPQPIVIPSPHSSPVYSVDSMPDAEATLVNHEPRPEQQPPIPPDATFAPDYAKMENEPPHSPHHSKGLTPIQRFWNSLSNMPWITEGGRITVDYTPRRTKRPDIPYQSRHVQPMPWYNESWSPVTVDLSVTPFPPPNNHLPHNMHNNMEAPQPNRNRRTSAPAQPVQYPGGYSRYQPSGTPLVQPQATGHPISPSSNTLSNGEIPSPRDIRSNTYHRQSTPYPYPVTPR